MFTLTTWMLLWEMCKIPFLPKQPPKKQALPDVGTTAPKDENKIWRRSC